MNLPCNCPGRHVDCAHLSERWQHSLGKLCRGMAALLLLSFCLPLFAQDSSENNILQELSVELISKNRDVQVKAIDAIAASGHPQTRQWLTSILEGELYIQKSDQNVVKAVRQGKIYSLSDPADGESLGDVKKKAISKIKINNAIRVKLRALISTLALDNPVTEQRLSAVNELIGKADNDVVSRIRELMPTESESSVKDAMRLLVSVHDLENGNSEQQMKALSFAKGNLNNELINQLRDLSSSATDDDVRVQASELLAQAELKRSRYAMLETVFFGISLGSVLVVSAIGLAITFGVMGVINMAHGELIMLGAYTTYFVQQLMPNAIDISLLFAIPAAFVVSGAVGILIERSVIRHLYGRPLETLLATFGISLILQQLVRTFVSSQNVAVVNPVWMSGSWIVNPALSLTLNRLVIIGFCLVVFALLLLLFSRSGFGLQMRAVAQDRQMARAMGIRSSRVDALTFGLGSGIAGIAGVALSQLGNVGPNLGQTYIIDSFMVVVFGGVGNLWGTLVAGMSLGIANKLVEPWAGAVMAKIIILVFIIFFIQRKPRGLFPQRGRAVED